LQLYFCLNSLQKWIIMQYINHLHYQSSNRVISFYLNLFWIRFYLFHFSNSKNLRPIICRNKRKPIHLGLNSLYLGKWALIEKREVTLGVFCSYFMEFVVSSRDLHRYKILLNVYILLDKDRSDIRILSIYQLLRHFPLIPLCPVTLASTLLP
jgi:hypothetical protein